MVVLKGFDAGQIEPIANLEPIPAGTYSAEIIESEMKNTKAGTGKFLQLTFQILGGSYEKRRLRARLNLENQNATTVQFARAELAAICRAVGVLAPRDSVEVHNLPLTISVRVRKRNDTDDLVNEIAGYSPLETLQSNGPAANEPTLPRANE